MNVADLINPKLVLCGLKHKTKEEVFVELARVVNQVHPEIGTRDILDALYERERQGAFSMTKGVLFPHSRTDKAKDIIVAIATIPDGLDMTSPDGYSIKVVVLFVIARKQAAGYLNALASLLSIFSNTQFTNQIVLSTSPEQVHELIRNGGIRQTTSTVASVMTKCKSCTPVSTIRDILSAMQTSGHPFIPVVDAEGKIIGEVTFSSVLKVGLRSYLLHSSSTVSLKAPLRLEKIFTNFLDQNLNSLKGSLITPHPPTVPEEAPEYEAIIRLVGSERVYVTKNGVLSGIVLLQQVLNKAFPQ